MGVQPPNIADEPTAAQSPRPTWGPARPQSAWAQPANPALAPGPRPAAPSTPKLPLLIAGGAVLLVAALIVAIVLSTSGGTPAKGAGRALAGASSAAPAPSSRTFTRVPSDSCATVSAAVISTYVPQATCQPSTDDSQNTSGSISKDLDWYSSPSAQGLVAQLDISLSIGKGAAASYSQDKLAIVTAMGSYATVTDHHAVSGVGDQAYLAYGTARPGPDTNTGPYSGDTVILVLVGNATFQLTYNAGTTNAGASATPLPQQQAEAAATAIAKDLIGHLS